MISESAVIAWRSLRSARCRGKYIVFVITISVPWMSLHAAQKDWAWSFAETPFQTAFKLRTNAGTRVDGFAAIVANDRRCCTTSLRSSRERSRKCASADVKKIYGRSRRERVVEGGDIEATLELIPQATPLAHSTCVLS